MTKPDFILCGDIHLSEEQPVCRLDNYFEAQTKKLKWLSDLQNELGCPILDSGDLFHRWKSSPHLIRYAIENLPEDMYSVPGNHDLPAHNMELFHKSSLGVLEATGRIIVPFKPIRQEKFHIFPFGWEEELTPCPKTDRISIAIAHVMTYSGRLPYPGCKDVGATALLRKMEGYDLILTGHNHKPFVIEEGGRILVNPGSLMRSTAGQADFEPRVYLYYADERRVEPVFVPIEKDVVSREHIDVISRRDDRMDSFVARLDGEFEVSLSFRNNLQNFFGSNRVRPGVKKAVWEAVDNGE